METNLLELIILVFGVLASFLMGVVVLYNNPKSYTNKIFSILAIVTSVWLLINFSTLRPEFSKYSLILSRLSIFFAVPQIYTVFLLSKTMPFARINLKSGLLYFTFFLSLAVMLITVSPFAFTDVDLVGGTVQPVPGPGMGAFAIYALVFSVSGLWTLFARFRKGTGEVKAQLQLVLIGILIMFALIILTIMIPVAVFQSTFFVQFSPLYALAFLGFTTYAIVRHRFLDIRLIVARAVSYSLLTLIVVVGYVFLLITSTTLIPGLDVEPNQVVAFTFISVILFFTSSPLRIFIERITDRFFFKGRYDTEVVLGKLTRHMASVIDMKLLSDSLLTTLITEMRITKGAFLIAEEHKIVNIESVGFDEAQLLSRPDIEKLLHGSRDAYIYEELGDDGSKDILRELGITAVFPLKVKEKEIGLMVFGPKSSGEIYNPQDVELLEIFAPQAAVALQNAQSYLEIQEFTRTLEQRVEDRTKELKVAQERELAKAKELLKLKDEFVFIATHDLRTPVTAIRGFIQLIEDDVQKLPESIKEDFGAIQEASNRLNQLVDDLLEVARSESGTIEVDLKPVEFKEVVEKTITQVKPSADKRGITVTMNMVCADDCKVMADEEKLYEVIENLLSNAVKYNKDNGNVTISASKQGNFALVEIEDTGLGIPKEQQEKVFSKFFRAHQEGTEEVPGTGLGLFVVRMLIEKMKGKITFESEEGVGTKFSFTLPLEKVV